MLSKMNEFFFGESLSYSVSHSYWWLNVDWIELQWKIMLRESHFIPVLWNMFEMHKMKMMFIWKTESKSLRFGESPSKDIWTKSLCSFQKINLLFALWLSVWLPQLLLHKSGNLVKGTKKEKRAADVDGRWWWCCIIQDWYPSFLHPFGCQRRWGKDL